MLNSILDGIGGTPLVALDRLRGDLPGRLLAKVEFYAPGGSVKDRIALRIVEEAEARGLLRPGGPVLELTSGNTGAGLAVVCAVKGYRLIAVMSAGNSVERAQMLRALGAEVVLVPQVGDRRPGQVSGDDLAAVERRAQELTIERGAFRADQFGNPANAAAHELGTGPEIWEQSGGMVTDFVAVVGTGGTFMGTARALKARRAAIRCHAVEPAGAAPLSGAPIESPRHRLQGAGYAFIPPLWDPALCDGYVRVTDEAAGETARALATREGLFCGYTAGANVWAALEVLRAHPGAVVATVLCDTGLKYLSTDLYSF